MSVDHLETGFRGRARSHEDLKGIRDGACPKVADILRVHLIGEAELLANGDL